MRNPRDTFLHFLADNLVSIPVHAIRYDPTNPAADSLEIDAVNVGFGSMDLEITVSTIYVKIDIISDTELVAVDMAQAVWLLLATKKYTPLMDYTIPLAPVATGTTLMWDKVRLTPVQNDTYYQYTCTLPAQFHNTLPT